MALRGTHIAWKTFLAFSFLTTHCFAQDNVLSTVKPRFSGDVRLRYQHLDQDAFIQSADALTARFSAALEVDLFDKTSFLAEIEGVAALIGDYNDGTGDKKPDSLLGDNVWLLMIGVLLVLFHLGKTIKLSKLFVLKQPHLDPAF